MRHCAAIALVGGVLGVALQLQQPALWALSLYLALLAAGCLGGVGLAFVRRAWPAALLAGALLAGALTGFGLTGARAAHFISSALNPALQGVDIEVTGRIASLPQRSAQAERFELVVESAARAGEAVQLPRRLQLGWYGGASAQPEGGRWSLSATSPGLRAGERWRFTVRLRSPHGNANPHGFDRERWLWEQGIQATGTVRSGPRDPVPQRLGATPWHPLDTLRQAVSERIEARVAGDPRSAGVLSALVVGDQSAIDRWKQTLKSFPVSPLEASKKGGLRTIKFFRAHLRVSKRQTIKFFLTESTRRSLAAHMLSIFRLRRALAPRVAKDASRDEVCRLMPAFGR